MHFEDQIVDGETGLMVEGAEPKAVALAVAAVLDDERLADRMGLAGRDRVTRSFTWDRRMAQLVRVLARAAA